MVGYFSTSFSITSVYRTEMIIVLTFIGGL